MKTYQRQDLILSLIFLCKVRFFLHNNHYDNSPPNLQLLGKVLRKIESAIFIDIHHNRPYIERLAV